MLGPSTSYSRRESWLSKVLEASSMMLPATAAAALSVPVLSGWTFARCFLAAFVMVSGVASLLTPSTLYGSAGVACDIRAEAAVVLESSLATHCVTRPTESRGHNGNSSGLSLGKPSSSTLAIAFLKADIQFVMSSSPLPRRRTPMPRNRDVPMTVEEDRELRSSLTTPAHHNGVDPELKARLRRCMAVVGCLFIMVAMVFPSAAMPASIFGCFFLVLWRLLWPSSRREARQPGMRVDDVTAMAAGHGASQPVDDTPCAQAAPEVHTRVKEAAGEEHRPEEASAASGAPAEALPAPGRLDGVVQTSDASQAEGPPALATTTHVDLSVAPGIHRLGPREQRHVRHLTSNATTTVQVCSRCRHCLWLTAMYRVVAV